MNTLPGWTSSPCLESHGVDAIIFGLLFELSGDGRKL